MTQACTPADNEHKWCITAQSRGCHRRTAQSLCACSLPTQSIRINLMIFIVQVTLLPPSHAPHIHSVSVSASNTTGFMLVVLCAPSHLQHTTHALHAHHSSRASPDENRTTAVSCSSHKHTCGEAETRRILNYARPTSTTCAFLQHHTKRISCQL